MRKPIEFKQSDFVVSENYKNQYIAQKEFGYCIVVFCTKIISYQLQFNEFRSCTLDIKFNCFKSKPETHDLQAACTEINKTINALYETITEEL